MGRAMRRLTPWLGLCLLFSCTPSREPEQPGVFALRYASPYPPQHPFSRADQRWIEHVQALSRGALRIDAFWSGTLTSADQSVIELRHGVADIAAIQPIYQRGGAHALRAQTGFYAGAVNFEEQVAVYKCLASHYHAFGAELHGLTVLAVQGGNLPGIVTRAKEVRGLHDLIGLRLRAPSELTELLEALGADPVNMPMGEVYAALARGVIDGVVAPLDALRSLHLAEVAHHYAPVAVPRGAYPARAIRSARLAQLPVALQTLLLRSGDVWEAALASELARALGNGRAYAREHGIRISAFEPAEQRAFDAAYNDAARRKARELTALGMDGEALFGAAQRWIARLRAEASPQPLGHKALCPGG